MLDIKTLVFIRDAARAHYSRELGRLLIMRHEAQAGLIRWEAAHPEGGGDHGWHIHIEHAESELRELEATHASVIEWLAQQGITR